MYWAYTKQLLHLRSQASLKTFFCCTRKCPARNHLCHGPSKRKARLLEVHKPLISTKKPGIPAEIALKRWKLVKPTYTYIIITYIHNTYHVTSKDLPKIPNKGFHYLQEESSMSLMLPYKFHVVQWQHSTAAAIFQHRGSWRSTSALPVAVARSWVHESLVPGKGLVQMCKSKLQAMRLLGTTVCSVEDNTIQMQQQNSLQANCQMLMLLKIPGGRQKLTGCPTAHRIYIEKTLQLCLPWLQWLSKYGDKDAINQTIMNCSIAKTPTLSSGNCTNVRNPTTTRSYMQESTKPNEEI